MSSSNSTNNTSVNGVLRTDNTPGSTCLIQAYNTTRSALDTFGTVTEGATPTFTLTAYNTGAANYTTFATLTSNVTATCDLNDAVTKAGAYIYRAGGTDVAIADGGTGISTTPTDGQLLIGKTSTNNYSLATLTQGTGITITNGSGAITIAATAVGLTWSAKTASFSADVNNGYTCINSSNITATLPSTFAVGDTIQFICNMTSPGVFGILARSGDSILMGSATTSASRTIESGDAYNAITLNAIVANTTWIVTSAIGNFNIPSL